MPKNASQWSVKAALLMLAFAAPIFAEIAARVALADSSIVATVVDIQTPETLCAKIDYLKRFSGRKILILGDSLVFGRAMREHGDTRWQEHELAAALQSLLASPAMPTLVLNLGLNGGLPADQAAIMRLFAGAQLNAIVSTISVRSFATDFATQKAAYSRPWLARETCLGHLAPTAVDRFENGLSRLFSLFKFRDLLQRAVFDGTPRERIAQVATALRRPSTSEFEMPGLADQQVMLLAKGRFSRISFEEPHAQISAFKDLRILATQTAGNVIFVYGKESGRLLPSLISKSIYQGHRQRLRDLVAPDDSVKYLEQIDIPSEHYLDYVHVDADGYRLIAQQIASLLGSQ